MKLKRNLLALAVASILVSGAAYADNSAPAQPGPVNQPGSTSPEQAAPATPSTDETAAKKAEDSTAELGEIKVTGVRASIERAISVKQNSNEIVEAISAEDIGKLPDNSIAESLARLPGIAAQRVGGRASTLSLRGFAGDFSGTLLNGREQVSTGDNRAIEFDQYPSELLSGVVVYKTPEASLVGQGVAGTIAMQSVRPLDYDKRVVQLGVRGETLSNNSENANTDSKGYRFNASYVDQYLDHTLGVAIGYARLKSPSQDQRWEAWGYTNVNVPAGTPGMTAGGTVSALGGEKIYSDSTEGTRDAVLATVEWRPNENYTSTLDLYYSKFDQTTTDAGFEVGFPYGCCGGSLANPIVSNGLLVGSTWTVKPVFREDLNTHNDDIKSIGWNNKFRFGNGWEASADLSYAKANAKQSILEDYAGTVGVQDTWRVTIDPTIGIGHVTPGLNYADPNVLKLTDSGGWGQDGYLKFPKTSDTLKAARFDLGREINGPISKISAGINYNERTKTRDSAETWVMLPGDTGLPNGSTHTGAAFNVPAACSTSSSFLLGFPPTLAWDQTCLLNSLYTLIPKVHQDILNKDWKVEEKVGTAYIKADIDTDVAGLPLRGNFGGQYVHANQHSDALAITGANNGYITSTTVVTPVTAGISYGNFLPSLNLVLTLPQENYLRFGAGREMARPRLDDMRANTEYGLNLTPSTSTQVTTCTNASTGVTSTCRVEGSSGNPLLKPFLADAYDLSWEKYWETKAYVSATFFFKSLKTYIYTQQIPHDFTGVPSSAFGPLVPASYVGLSSEPQNGTGGYMRGYELSASLPLDILFQSLDGFGVQTWFAQTDSDICPGGPGSCGPFPGLSKYTAGATVYFEKAGFSARLAATHRSNYLGEIQAFGADRGFTNIRAETVADFQVGYAIQGGTYEGVSFLLQVQNLFNEPYREFFNPSQPKVYTDYGRRVLLGVNYKF
jgi:iron complex outermembrane receptor protein